MASRNESTITSPNANPASQCALYVALQTMKERCLSLQLRLTSVQEDNLALRQAHIQTTAATDSQELLALVQELSHSKELLNDRLNMVASENRHLWSRLSHMTKANSVEVVTSDKPKAAPPMPNTSNQTTNPNLIRSKTFTQNAPNPALRSKMQPEVQCAITDLSLEEISLKVLSEILDSKAELERICGEMSAPTSSKAANAYGFGYLNDDDAHDVTLSETGGGGVGDDVQLELKRCSEGMVEIRAEVLRQQSDIKVALSNLRKTRSVEVCSSCKHNMFRQPSYVPATNQTHIDIADSLSTFGKSVAGTTAATAAVTSVTASFPVTKLIDFLDQKRRADSLEKMCPMCARIYNHAESFDVFQEHVESHFIDDSDMLDASLEKNFEMVSHTVGDF